MKATRKGDRLCILVLLKLFFGHDRATDGKRLVMPAYGALTGGLNLMDEAFTHVFPQGVFAGVLGRDGVYLAARERLIPDTIRATG